MAPLIEKKVLVNLGQSIVVCFAALTENLKFQGKKNSHSLAYPFLKICNHKEELHD